MQNPNLQELQAVKGKVEELTDERDKACLESVITRQQRDCHAEHAQLLVRENKRLFNQLQALKLQQEHAVEASAKLNRALQINENSPKGRTIAQVNCKRVQSKSAQTSQNEFFGQNVQNVLHSRPFDLSMKSSSRQDKRAQAVVRQAQQIRAAKQEK